MALTILIVIAIILEVIEFFVSPFWVYTVFHFFVTLVFAARRIGIITPFEKIRTAEITGDVIITLFAWILHKLTWKGAILLVILRALSLLLVWYDDKHYLYIEEDI